MGVRFASWVMLATWGATFVLSATEIGLARSWNHAKGVLFGSLGIPVALGGVFLWWARHRDLFGGPPRLAGPSSTSPPRSSDPDLGPLIPSTEPPSDGYAAPAGPPTVIDRLSREGCPWSAPRTLFTVGGSLYAALVVFLVLVHAVAPDPAWTTLPLTCGTHTDNCAMVRPAVSYRAGGRTMVAVRDMATRDAVERSRRWALGLRGTAVLGERADFLHVRFVSKTWGFPDDFAMLAVAVRNGTWNGTEFWCVSESRIGRSDFGVNTARIEAYLDFVEDLRRTSGNGTTRQVDNY